MIKFGILGCGGIARRFAAAVNQVEGVELEAAAAKDWNRANAFKREFGVNKAYGSYTELLDDEEVNAVYIALTHNFHYEMVVKCLERGIPCLCEKPLVLTRKEAQELCDLAREKKTLLMEAFWTKVQPAYKKAKTWIKEGKVGKVKLAEASFCQVIPFDPRNRFYNKELAGGAMYDLGVYVIQSICGLLSEYPERVGGLAHIGTTGVDEWDVLTMQFPSGALASCSCGFHANTDKTVRIYGTKGRIELYPIYAPESCSLYDEDGARVEWFEGDGRDGFVYEVEHFKELVLTRAKESHLVPFADTLDCARVFDEFNKKWGLGV